MRVVRFLPLATIVVGVALLRYAYVNGGAENWNPVNCPFPGKGLRILTSFTLASGGRFGLEVESPALPRDKTVFGFKVLPPVPCQLKAIVSGPHGFRLERDILEFHNGGWTLGTDIYTPAEVFILPRGGDYKLDLASLTQAEAFSRTGAVVRLTRFEPVEFGYPLAKAAAYVIFFLWAIGEARQRK
ncbi:MAG TPA: hypothetical protein VOA87_02180 [Thermoanaerobaculia bacterium]|nr:hypothetical protein [Thermoanaerobaculia bacterium]